MKITHNVKDILYQEWIKGYEAWVDQFVENVLTKANIDCRQVIIQDIESSKRIFLDIDGKDYIIRTWGFYEKEHDENGAVCEEMVEYTLFEGNESIYNGEDIISWTN